MPQSPTSHWTPSAIATLRDLLASGATASTAAAALSARLGVRITRNGVISAARRYGVGFARGPGSLYAKVPPLPRRFAPAPKAPQPKPPPKSPEPQPRLVYAQAEPSAPRQADLDLGDLYEHLRRAPRL